MAFGSLSPRFRGRSAASPSSADGTETVTDDGRPVKAENQNQADLKSQTKPRRISIIFSCICFFLSVVFLILIEIGNTPGGSIRGDIYFFKLDLSDIIVQALPTAQLTLTNSIARTLGLHDFYQVGLWNFCEGYKDVGITHCSDPTTSFWFNPVDVLLNELLAGASIALPNEVNDILTILRLASHIMFGFFLAALSLNFVLMLIAPVVIYSRWWSLPFSVFSLVSTILVLVASTLGTVMSFVFKYAMSSQPDLNVRAEIGMKMLIFMWLATGFTIFSFIIHIGLCCCCTSRRDIKTGRREGKHPESGARAGGEKGGGGIKLPTFSRVDREARPSE